MIQRYSDIVVGSSLSAILFAFENKFPIIFTEAQKPFRFDYLKHDFDLSFLKITNKTKTLNTLNGKKLVGLEKLLLWERLVLLLSVDGNVPLSNLCSKIRLTDNKITCFNEYAKIKEFNFDNCHYFYDKNTTGFVKEKTIDTQQILCYDWIAFNRGGKHDVDFIQTDENLAYQIWFYPSDRIDGKTSVKDACVISRIQKNELLNFNYSETMARFKLEHEMYSRGMKGPSNGYGPNGKLKHYKFRTTSITRTTSCVEPKIESQSDSVKICKIDEESMLQNLQKSSMGYNRFLKWL